MAFTFTDGFDCYAAAADEILGYWDSGGATNTLVTGRFIGSRAIQMPNISTGVLVKSSGQNDAVHHISFAFQHPGLITGSSIQLYINIGDGATAQCTMAFRTDGSIQLQSGGVGGAVLATYSSAFTGGVWNHFEFEIVINNTTGSFKVRKNGNTSDDFASTGLNTRGGTANNYANRITLGASTSASGGNHMVDDFIWKSSAAAGTWIGEVRCRTRYPNADSGTPQWTRAATGAALIQSYAGAGANNPITAVGSAFLDPFTCLYAGSIASIMISTYGAVTGNAKAAIWADNAGVPGAVLASCSAQAAVSGNNVFTLSTPLTVTPGQKIWIGMCCDTAGGSWNTQSLTSNGATGTLGYSTFPQANPSVTGGNRLVGSNIVYSAATGNYQMVQEAQQDGASSYNYDSTVNDVDRFTISAIDATPATTFATTVRGLLQKSDAGTRNTQVLLKSGATEVGSGSAANNAGVWGWQYRTDETDPATGSAWTATAVNNALIGVQVTA